MLQEILNSKLFLGYKKIHPRECQGLRLTIIFWFGTPLYLGKRLCWLWNVIIIDLKTDYLNEEKCVSNFCRPHDTPFEDGTFKLTIEFTEEYPNKPPTVRFVSKMFHPNVYADGGICLDILQNRWSPTYDVSAILTSIQVIINSFF